MCEQSCSSPGYCTKQKLKFSDESGFLVMWWLKTVMKSSWQEQDRTFLHWSVTQSRSTGFPLLTSHLLLLECAVICCRVWASKALMLPGVLVLVLWTQDSRTGL